MTSLFEIDGRKIEPMSTEELELFKTVFKLNDTQAKQAQASQHGKFEGDVPTKENK